MEILHNQVIGLTIALETLRKTEKIFIKAESKAESIEKARADKEKLEEDLKETKIEKAAQKIKKAEMLKSVCEPLAKAIDEFLPKGCAVINMEEGLYIGWNNEESLTPYLGLSGGEKVMFDSAFSNALLGDSKNKVIAIEAGELDEENLLRTMEMTKKSANNVQLIINTWFDPTWDEDSPIIAYAKSNGWKLVRL